MSLIGKARGGGESARRHDDSRSIGSQLCVIALVLSVHLVGWYAVTRFGRKHVPEVLRNIAMIVLPAQPAAVREIASDLPKLEPLRASALVSLKPLSLPRSLAPQDIADAPTSEVTSESPPTTSVPTVSENAHDENTWRSLLAAWIKIHKSYPRIAQQRGLQGAVTLEFEVQPTGLVSQVTLLRSSGVPVLDKAALDLFTDAQLPPFTPGMQQQPRLISLTLDYFLRAL